MPRSSSEDLSFRTFGPGSAYVPSAPGFSGTRAAQAAFSGAPQAVHVRWSPEGGAPRGGLWLLGSLLSRVPTRAREAAVLSRERRHLVAAVLLSSSRSQALGFPAPPRNTSGGGGAQAAGHASRARSRARGRAGLGGPRPRGAACTGPGASPSPPGCGPLRARQAKQRSAFSAPPPPREPGRGPAPPLPPPASAWAGPTCQKEQI